MIALGFMPGTGAALAMPPPGFTPLFLKSSVVSASPFLIRTFMFSVSILTIVMPRTESLSPSLIVGNKAFLDCLSSTCNITRGSPSNVVMPVSLISGGGGAGGFVSTTATGGGGMGRNPKGLRSIITWYGLSLSSADAVRLKPTTNSAIKVPRILPRFISTKYNCLPG